MRQLEANLICPQSFKDLGSITENQMPILSQVSLSVLPVCPAVVCTPKPPSAYPNPLPTPYPQPCLYNPPLLPLWLQTFRIRVPTWCTSRESLESTYSDSRGQETEQGNSGGHVTELCRQLFFVGQPAKEAGQLLDLAQTNKSPQSIRHRRGFPGGDRTS